MDLNVTIFLISFFFYGTTLLFVKYAIHKAVLLIPIISCILLMVSGLISNNYSYICYSIIAGVLSFEFLKKIAEKIFFMHLKIKDENKRKEYLQEKLDKSLVDIFIEKYEEKETQKEKEKSDDKKLKNENKEVIDTLEERIQKRKNKLKNKK